MQAARAVLAFLVWAPPVVLLAQGGPAPRPLSATGIITDPGFAGALANSVQGTPNWRPGRPNGGPVFVGGFAPWTGFYQGPGYFTPPPPVVMEQVNAPAVVLQQPAIIAAPIPDAPVVSVYSYPARKQTEDTQAPPALPNAASQNAAALQALSQSMEAANALANGGGVAGSTKASNAKAANAQTANEGLVLIALKDQNIVTAIAYWTDRSELKYVTPARQQKQVPLSQVDVKLSERLNSERRVPFHLDPSPQWEPAPQY
jgi:hypothetical protein